LLLTSFADQLRETVERFEEKWYESAKPPFGQSQTLASSLVEERSPVTEVNYDDGFSGTSSTSCSSTNEHIQSSDFPHSARQSVTEEHSFQTLLDHDTGQEEDESLSAMDDAHVFSQEQYQQENDIHNRVKELIDSLSQRGTGRHTCPYGAACSKGGIKNGQFVVFERNSAFRAHLLKHERLYTCNLPYCTAKGGFARIDQLRRHQHHVPHHKH